MGCEFEMCKDAMKQSPQAYSTTEMTSSLGDDIEKELNGLIESKEYTLSCRIKVFFLGDKNAGKTSLVRSLVGENACVVNEPSESTTRYIWKPLKGSGKSKLLKRQPTLEEKSLVLDLWDMPGRKVCQGIHQMFLSQALYILVFNLVDTESYLQLPKYISYVQAKVPGCPMLIVATRGDKLFTNDERMQKAAKTMAGIRAAQQAEMDSIKNDITQISDLGADPKLLDQLEWLEGLLQDRPKLKSPIHVVSCKTGKGLQEVGQEILKLSLDCELFPHTGELLTPAQVRLCELLSDERSRGKVLLTWDEFRQLADDSGKASKNEILHDEKGKNLTGNELQKTLILLERMGTVCGFPSTRPLLAESTPIPYVCVSPHTLSTLLCSCHLDNHRKTFHLDGGRFWPAPFKRPDPSALIKFLEEIPYHGVVREVVLPLLWQEVFLNEEQIGRIVDLLVTSGLFTPETVSAGETKLSGTDLTNTQELVLPKYPALSQHRKYHANLMGFVPDKRPMLNWSPKPFKGDVQVTWRYSFPCGTPAGLTQRMLGACRAIAIDYFYIHQWRYGLLTKMDDAVVCVELDTVDLYVDISCRVNADDPTEEEESVKFLWAHIAPYIKATRQFLRQWPGLVYRLELLVFGSVFYDGTSMGGEQVFLVGQCFMSARSGQPILYTEGGVERSLNGGQLLQLDGKEHATLDEWLEDILSTRQTVIENRTTTPLSPPPQPASQKDTTEANQNGITTTTKQKKKLEIKWELSSSDNMKNKPVSSADTGSNNNSSTGKNGNSSSDSKDEDTNSQTAETDAEKATKKGESIVMTEEEQLHEATKVASGFVASLLARAVADYIQAVHEDNHAGVGEQAVTKAQVDAARLAAKAAVSAQTGEIDDTAQAVMDAAKAVHIANSNSTKTAIKSKTCSIL